MLAFSMYRIRFLTLLFLIWNCITVVETDCFSSLLMERFFSVPGMGPLLTDAIQRYDLNVVQTLVILYAVLGIVGVFLGDVLMMVVDPRITLTGKEEAR